MIIEKRKKKKTGPLSKIAADDQTLVDRCWIADGLSLSTIQDFMSDYFFLFVYISIAKFPTTLYVVSPTVRLPPAFVATCFTCLMNLVRGRHLTTVLQAKHTVQGNAALYEYGLHRSLQHWVCPKNHLFRSQGKLPSPYKYTIIFPIFFSFYPSIQSSCGATRSLMTNTWLDLGRAATLLNFPYTEYIIHQFHTALFLS